MMEELDPEINFCSADLVLPFLAHRVASKKRNLFLNINEYA